MDGSRELAILGAGPQRSDEMSYSLSETNLLNGLILGWSVAWPPGPINAEIIRRSLLPRWKGGGFSSAWGVGLGACTGDFLWAVAVSAGAGALINTPILRTILSAISLALLLFLTGMFVRGAWLAARENPHDDPCAADERSIGQMASRGYFLGFTLALTSPWNIGFWLAVIGSQSGKTTGVFAASLTLASAVVLGTIAWVFFLCIAVKVGARIFARPFWQVLTQALTAAVMLFFAARLVLQLSLGK